MTTSYMIAPGESPEDVAQRRKMAQALMMQGMDASPVQHWTQGAARLAQALLGGYQLGEVKREDAAERDAARQQMAALLGGGGSAQPAPAMPGPKADATEPRGIRNNNPGNIEAGPFAARQPGYVGSDGRFARFETPEQGVGAMSNLLDAYGRKGINTVSGAINRWAPPSDNNPTSAYAAFVAKEAGVDPNAPVNMADPAMRQKMIDAMIKFENGKSMPVRTAALSPATVTDAMSAPDRQPQPAQQPAMQQTQPPVQTAQAGPDRAQLIQMLNNRYTAPLAQSVLQEQIKRQYDPRYKFMTAGDTLYRTDERRGVATPVTQALKPPEATRIAQEMMANPTAYGFKGKDDPELITAVKQRLGGGSSVNIDQRQEGAFKNTAATGQAKRFLELSDGALAAKQNMSDLDTLQTLGAAIETGKLAEWKVAAGPYLKTIGINVANLGEGEAYDAIVQRLAPGLRTPGSGTTSDRDVIGYLKSLPSLGKTPEGNAIISATNRAIYETRLKAAEIADSALNGDITPTQANKMLRELPDPMQGYRDFVKNVKAPPAAASPPASGPPMIKTQDEFNKLKSGDEFIAPDGTTRRKP